MGHFIDNCCISTLKLLTKCLAADGQDENGLHVQLDKFKPKFSKDLNKQTHLMADSSKYFKGIQFSAKIIT